MISCGRKRILVFGAERTGALGPARLRLDGYLEALAGYGIEYDESLVTMTTGWSRLEAANAVRMIIDSDLQFDGVVAFRGVLALGAMRVMQGSGIRIPEDVAVIGFDDIYESRYALPTLTSVEPGRPEMARVAVTFLPESFSHRGSSPSIPPREYFADFSIVERESTARAVVLEASSSTSCRP